jgi:branched-chain amino acid transport system ATP-binding protein
MIKAIAGLVPVHGGDVTLRGRSILGRPTHKLAGEGLAYVPQVGNVFVRLSVQENLEIGGFIATNADARLAQIYALFPDLARLRRLAAGKLSGGQRQMLAVGRALMAQPKLLMLDEPSLGLAPLVVREIFHIIERLREQGVSILLVEQNARAALEVANYGYVLETGEISLQGPAAELAVDPRVIETYLGAARAR